MSTPAILAGQTEEHLCPPGEVERLGARMHQEAVDAFVALRSAAAEAGFDVAILSGFRSFDRQLGIWNRKASGEQPVHDSEARPMDLATLSDEGLVYAILRWSALPGASRHHWGTDLDIYDAAARPEGYEIELVPAEVDAGGMFAPLHEWLDRRIAAGTSFGWYRPYDTDRGGVAPERWHLSYAPIAVPYARTLTFERLHAVIAGVTDMRLRDVVLDRLPVIFERFVHNVNPVHP